MSTITKEQRAKLDKEIAKDRELPVHCEKCGLGYEVDGRGDPRTIVPYTCDDCRGYVPTLDEV